MLTSERSYKRKIQEAYLALQLESKYTKDQILEAYLNDVNMGEGNYGVKRDVYKRQGNDLYNIPHTETLQSLSQISRV